MSQLLDNIMETGMISTPQGESISIKPHSISRSEGAFLQSLIAEYKPIQTLEVGMAYGISTLFICDALARVGGTKHIVIDPGQEQSYRNIGRHNVDKAGFGKMIEFYEMTSDRALPQLAEKGTKLDFAFIDGWHTFDFTLVDFYYVDKMLKPGGVVVLDDADWAAVRKLCRYIATNLSYKVIVPEKEKQYLNFSWERNFLNILLKTPGIGPLMRRLLKPEIVDSDKVLGLSGSSIAFLKESDDKRSWDHHAEF